jgi:hypothetical protein
LLFVPLAFLLVGTTTTTNMLQVVAKLKGGGAPSYIVDEDFDEASEPPSSGLWSTVAGTPVYNKVTVHALTNEAFSNDSGDHAKCEIGSTPRFVKFRYEAETLDTSNRIPFTTHTNNAGAYCVGWWIRGSDKKVSIYINAATKTFSSTFTMTADVVYYVWIDWVPSGRCYVGINTANAKPAMGTDTSTAWASLNAAESDDTTGGTIDELHYRTAGATYYIDNVFVDDVAIP